MSCKPIIHSWSIHNMLGVLSLGPNMSVLYKNNKKIKKIFFYLAISVYFICVYCPLVVECCFYIFYVHLQVYLFSGFSSQCFIVEGLYSGVSVYIVEVYDYLQVLFVVDYTRFYFLWHLNPDSAFFSHNCFLLCFYLCLIPDLQLNKYYKHVTVTLFHVKMFDYQALDLYLHDCEH